MLDTKRCFRCGGVKLLSEFNKDRSKKDGYRTYCRECDHKQKTEYYAKHAEELSAKYMAYYEIHREEVRAKQAQYYADHCEEIKLATSKYYAEHREKMLVIRRQYQRTYIDKTVKARKKRYRQTDKYRNRKAARVNNLRVAGGEKLTPEIIAEIKSEYGRFCPYCNHKIEIGHIDHIVPVSKGGTNDRDNLVYVCAPCNLKKNNKSLLEFMIYRRTMATDTLNGFING